MTSAVDVIKISLVTRCDQRKTGDFRSIEFLIFYGVRIKYEVWSFLRHLSSKTSAIDVIKISLVTHCDQRKTGDFRSIEFLIFL